MAQHGLSEVHNRYIRLSSFFKSAWTFHQFLQGMQKVFENLGPTGYSGDFQTVYADLKKVSQNLSETTADRAAQQLDRVEQRLEPLVKELLQTDGNVPAGDLRRFFQRVKNYDDNILTQLVKFYLYAKKPGDKWDPQRLDKADFLCTKLAEEYHDNRDVFVPREPGFLRELAQGLWTALEGKPISQTELAAFDEEIREHGRQISSVDSMDALHGGQLIPAYRDLKHQLNDRFFHPRLLQAVLDTNLKLKNTIQQLYRYEEQRIVAEYQEVFELERDVPVDVQLGEELSQFRVAVERFEGQLQGENVRIDDLADLRRKVRELVPKLQPTPAESGPLVRPREAQEFLAEQGEQLTMPSSGSSLLALELDYVREQYDAIVNALDDTNPTVDPRKVVLQPEIFVHGLSPREVVAYRRIFGGGTCDLELEQFILQAAALRNRIEKEVEEIKEILDDTAVTGEAPVFRRARKTIRIADLQSRRFEHRIEHSVLGGDTSEAQAMQRLKMRMIRAYSGLWLMVYRD